MTQKKILFVCLGNICRSPLAEGILRRQAAEQGIDVFIDSAGTGDYHLGELADPRARQVGTSRGCDMSMRARQVRSQDFDEFDLIVAMDHSNLRSLERWQGSRPEKVRLARCFDPSADDDIVPDPYTGDLSDFEDVADMLEAACRGILDTVDEPKGAKV